MKKYILLSFSFFIIIILSIYGCSSSSGGNIFVNSLKDTEISYKETIIDKEGRLSKISFPSGASIVASEKNTLEPGIKVVLSEQKLSESNLAFFKDSVYGNVYIYKINAVQESKNSLTANTQVSTLEKPFRVTLPNKQGSKGLCYIGVRSDESDIWRFFNVNDEYSCGFQS